MLVQLHEAEDRLFATMQAQQNSKADYMSGIGCQFDMLLDEDYVVTCQNAYINCLGVYNRDRFANLVTVK